MKDHSSGGCCGTFLCALLLLSGGGLKCASKVECGGLFAAKCCTGLLCKYDSGKLECPVWCRTRLLSMVTLVD